jgi:hypothetical protein
MGASAASESTFELKLRDATGTVALSAARLEIAATVHTVTTVARPGRLLLLVVVLVLIVTSSLPGSECCQPRWPAGAARVPATEWHCGSAAAAGPGARWRRYNP